MQDHRLKLLYMSNEHIYKNTEILKISWSFGSNAEASESNGSESGQESQIPKAHKLL
jgi:hypothetical protein